MNTIVLTNSNSATDINSKLSLRLTSPMRLEDSLICLSDMTMYYSWPNIAERYGNNKFFYQQNDITIENGFAEITILDGLYEIKDINNYLHFVMKSSGDKPDDKGHYGISINANRIYNRVTISVNNNYILELPSKGFNEILGFKNNLSIINQEINGNEIPQVERVESVFVHCNLAQNSYQLDSSLIYSFTPDKPAGSLLNIKPNFPQWRRTRNNVEVNQIDVWLTDQNNKLLDLDDPKLKVELQIMPAGFMKIT